MEWGTPEGKPGRTHGSRARLGSGERLARALLDGRYVQMRTSLEVKLNNLMRKGE